MRRFFPVLVPALLLAAACSKEPGQIISIGTGGTAGVYYPYGGGLAEIWTKHVPGVRAVAEVTGASVENVRLAHRGETVIGEVMCDVAYHAYHGEGPFQGEPQKILALAAMYPSLLQLVTLESSGATCLDDLAGRTVSIGAPGSGTTFMCGQILTALGFDRDRLDTRRLSFVESANALKDHSIDVGAWVVAPKASSIMDLATTHDVRVLPFSPQEQRTISERFPFYTAADLPAGSYRGVTAAVPTLEVWNVIICTADLPDDLVYQLTKVLYEQNAYLRRVHPYAEFTTPENATLHSSIPLHPGAIRYLTEIGIAVPRRLQPGAGE